MTNANSIPKVKWQIFSSMIKRIILGEGHFLLEEIIIFEKIKVNS